MPGNRARTLGVLAAVAGAAGLAGCAAAGERLPECRGRALPINGVSAPAAAAATVKERVQVRSRGESDAH